MKKLFLLLMFLLAFKLCFAAVTAEIISKDIDSNGNIRIWTIHAVDGVEIESKYPKIGGHFVFCTRYSSQNFKDCKNKTEIENYILNDIKNYSNVLVQKEFDKKSPKTFNQIKIDYNTSVNQAFATTNLDKLVGKSLSITEVKEKIDSDGDGVLDKEITLKPYGSKIETDIP